MQDLVAIGAGPVGLVASPTIGPRGHAGLVLERGDISLTAAGSGCAGSPLVDGVTAAPIRLERCVVGAVTDAKQLITRHADLAGARSAHITGEPTTCV